MYILAHDDSEQGLPQYVAWGTVIYDVLGNEGFFGQISFGKMLNIFSLQR